MRSYYRTLGIEPGAEPAAIRAAYLSLIKRYHPDARQFDGSFSESRAKEITRAFWVLSDPGRRAAYDQELEREHEREASLVAEYVYRPPAYPIVVYARPSMSRQLAKLVAVLVVILTASASGALLEGSSSPFEALRSQREPSVTQFNETRPKAVWPRINSADIDDAVGDLMWIVSDGRRPDAVNYSLHCFREFRANPSYRLFDRCAAFDQSANWIFGSSAAPRERTSIFFTAGPRREKHLVELATISPDSAANIARLAAIDKQVVSAMAELVSPRDYSARRRIPTP